MADPKWRILYGDEPKGALLTVSISGQAKKVLYRFELTEGSGIVATHGIGLSMRDDKLAEHIASAIIERSRKTIRLSLRDQGMGNGLQPAGDSKTQASR
jgi:hypothetical protein